MRDRAGLTRADVGASIPFAEEGEGEGEGGETFHFGDEKQRKEE